MGQESEGQRGSGIPRRTLIKRGAIVGGLVWATPVVQSLRIPAHAQEGQMSELCAACLAATIDPPGPPPPVTSHVTFVPTTACCDCIAAGGGNLDAVVLCAVAGTCTILPAQSGPGPCP
jgi:hypothetical protein